MNVTKLNELIDGKKMTKARVIKMTGISRPALDAILSGNDFKVSNLEKLANCLAVQVGYFFDEEDTVINEQRIAGRDYVEKGKIEHHQEAKSDCPSDVLIAEKDERIAELKERIEELKERIEELKKSNK